MVFFLGDKIKPEDVSGFTDILPGTIISPKEDGKYKIILGETGNLLLTEKDIDLTTVEAYKYFKILPKSDSKIFLNFDTQDVCLIGSEKVMLFASTVDEGLDKFAS